MDGALRDAASGALRGVGHRLLPAVILKVLDALFFSQVVAEDSPLSGVRANLSLLDWDNVEGDAHRIWVQSRFHFVLKAVAFH